MDLVIFTGLQASGKSTFFRSCFEATHKLVSKDLLHNNKNRDRRQRCLISTALESGSSVVVDNTNPAIEDRGPLIVLGREHGARIVGYYFESQTRRCLERNRQRTGKARVPDVALYATAKKLVPPSYAEGFDELYDVQISEDSTFEVTPRNSEADG